jgi:hypothetical protein
MSRFNIRSLSSPPPSVAPIAPVDKKPNAYAAMKSGTGPPVRNVIVMSEEPTKRGRPSKDELRKQKLALSDAHIATFVEAKPTRAKLRTFIEERIKQLEEEKR